MIIDGVEIDDDGFVLQRPATFDPSEREIRISMVWLDLHTVPGKYVGDREGSHNRYPWWKAKELAPLIWARSNVKVSDGAVLVAAHRLGLTISPELGGMVVVLVKDGDRLLKGNRQSP